MCRVVGTDDLGCPRMPHGCVTGCLRMSHDGYRIDTVVIGSNYDGNSYGRVYSPALSSAVSFMWCRCICARKPKQTKKINENKNIMNNIVVQ